MALRQRQHLVARHGAEDRNIKRGDRIGDELAVAFAADAIEHHASDAHGADHAQQSRARQLRPTATGPPHRAPERTGSRNARGEIGGRAAPRRRARRPRRTGPSRLRSRRGRRRVPLRAQRASSNAGGIAQLSRLHAVAPRRRGMKGGVDVVRPAFAARTRNAAPRKRSNQRERDRRLAGARTRGGDDESRARSFRGAHVRRACSVPDAGRSGARARCRR